MTPEQKVEMLRAAMHKALHAKSFEDAGQTMARALAATAEPSAPKFAGYDLPALPAGAGTTQREMMQDALMLHVGQQHTEHCWARLAWGDGECECRGLPYAPDARRAELLRWVGIYGEHCIRAGRSLTASRFYTDDDLTERAQNTLKAMPTLATLLEAK